MKIQSAQFRLWASQHRFIFQFLRNRKKEREREKEKKGWGGREEGWTRKRQRETDRQTRDR